MDNTAFLKLFFAYPFHPSILQRFLKAILPGECERIGAYTIDTFKKLFVSEEALWNMLVNNYEKLDLDKINIQHLRIVNASWLFSIDESSDDDRDERMTFTFDYIKDFGPYTYLDFSHCSLTDDELVKIVDKLIDVPHLEILDLSNNKLTDIGLRVLSKLPQTTDLILGGIGKLSDETIQSLHVEGKVNITWD